MRGRSVTRGIPKDVVFINFIAGELLLDPRHLWSALMSATDAGTISRATVDRVHYALDQKALYLAQRDYILRAAVRELKLSLAALADLIPQKWRIKPQHEIRVLRNAKVYAERDRALLAFDSALFEFRSYLELLATFVHVFLVEIGKPPSSRVNHSSGAELQIVGRKAKLNTHNFLKYLCDQLSCPEDWYIFLSNHRNFFTHGAAPYIAIECLPIRPPAYEFLILRTNIHDFKRADPADYIRISEFESVVTGIKTLARAVQGNLISVLKN